MDIRRVILYAALALVVYSLWTKWQTDYPPIPQTKAATLTSADANMLPSNMATNETTDNSSVKHVNDTRLAELSKSIHVQTDVLDLTIDLQHGDIINATLLDYPVSVSEKDKPFTLLQNSAEERYVANSNLFVAKGQVIENADGNYTSELEQYQLTAGQKQLIVTLKGKNTEGVLVHKEYVLTKGSYLIDVRYVLLNEGAAVWKGYMNTQLLRSSPKEDKSSMFHVGSYTGSSYSNPGKHRYEKVNFKDMTKNNLDVEAQGGWIAMQQHYFLSAWVPVADSKNRFYTRAIDGDYTIGAVSQPIAIDPQQKQEVSSRLYLGPEVTSELKAIAPCLDLTVDYGWLWFLSSLLFSWM